MNPFAGSTSILDIIAAVLVAGLGADEWREREAYTAAAARCEFAQPYLYGARFNHDIEVARRAERLTIDAETRHELALVRALTPDGFNRWPYLDWALAVNGLDPTLVRFIGEAQESSQWGAHRFVERHDNWMTYREAARRYTLDAIRTGTPLATLREQMHRGARLELNWLATGQTPP